MSMISSLINELRELALWLDDEFYDVEAAKVRDAADTIWQLRDDLQRANAENARLRSELDSVGTAAYLYGRSDLKAENEKLRELVDELYPLADYGAMDASELDRAHDLMRELGIEVDG